MSQEEIPTRKRKASDQDPDYEDVEEHQKKRQKLIEATGKEATISKIESILQRQFSEAIKEKEVQICAISQRLMDAQRMLDRLRACIVSSYYSVDDTSSQDSLTQSASIPIHPTVKKAIGKHPKNGVDKENCEQNPEFSKQLYAQADENTLIGRRAIDERNETAVKVQSNTVRGKEGKTKSRIIVGNISRYIPIERREENDPSTHKWMVYVRGPKDSPYLNHFVKEVWFFLHPSYRPNDLVIVRESPYHLTRRGWGEFPVRVQVHFQDSRNKQVDIIHHLKLDRTYTGLQTLGAETLVDVEVESTSIGKDLPTPNTPSIALPNGDCSLDIKVEAHTDIESQPEKLMSPSQIKKEPEDVYTQTVIPCVTEIKQEPVDSVGEPTSPIKVTAATNVSTPKKGSTEPGWVQFQICGENVTPTKSKPPTPKSSSKSGWTNISDLTKGEKPEKIKPLAVPVSSTSVAGTSTMLSLGKGTLSIAQQPGKGGTMLATMIGAPQGIIGGHQNQLKIVGPGLKVGSPGNVAAATSAPTQLVYVKCIDKSGMALLTPKQVQPNTGVVPFNNSDILLKVTPPASSKLDSSKMKMTMSTTSKPAVTFSALPKNTTLVYCSSKVSSQQCVTVTSPQGSKKGGQMTAVPPAGNIALAKTGQYFIQYPAKAVPPNSSADPTSILRPRLSSSAPVLQTVAVPTARAGGVGTIQNVILTKPGTGKGNLQSILTTPSQAGTSKDPKQSPTIAIVVSSPGTYVLGKPVSQKSQVDGKTVLTNVLPGGKSSIMVKSGQQQGKTVSLLRPGLIQTKMGSSGIQMSGKAVGLPASTIPVGIGPGQIALITTPTTTTNTLVSASAASSGAKKFDLGPTAGSKAQSSLLYIVPTSSANIFKPSEQACIVPSVKPLSQPTQSILGATKKAKQALSAAEPSKDESHGNFGIKIFDIADMHNMEHMVKYAVKRFPLVSANRDKFALPFCATDLKQFLGWTIAKQRAAEWTRACTVRRVICWLIAQHGDQHLFGGEAVWTRRQIVMWCRKNSFTPPTSNDITPNTTFSRYMFPLKSPVSLSNYVDILSKVEQFHCGSVKPAVSSTDAEDIDIVSENQSNGKKRSSKEIESTGGTDAEGSQLNAEFYSNVIGDILMRVTETFVEDLVRGATSNMHEEGLFPTEVGARDVFRAVKKISSCDFLTNKYLGLLSE